jgi:cytochrome c-type biogenesis protein CcsB
MEIFMFMAALIALGLSAILYIWRIVALRKSLKRNAIAGGSQAKPRRYSALDAGPFAVILGVSGLVFLTLSIIARATITGHGPFSNMYEFSLVFAWGIMAAGFYFQWRYRTPAISAIAVPIALAFLIFAYTLPSQSAPLVPALQQSLLLTVHVAVAIIAYGTFAIAFGAGALYLVQERKMASWLPRPAMLDDIGYRGVIIGFPFMTLTIILGAFWADVAWGRYWGWDPKETASLVTWLIYGGYLHARVLRGWRGTRSAVLLIVGFCAVLLTYFGNYFFGGLHAYQ